MLNVRLWLNMTKARILAPLWYWKHRHFKCAAGYGCDWVYPYGFVPEADCPIHDPPPVWHGRVIWASLCNGTDDNNDGLSPDHPVTLEKALTMASGESCDFIFWTD